MNIRTMPPEAQTIHRNLASACRDSARRWRDIARVEMDRNLQLAIFAYRCALDNERIAEEESAAFNQSSGGPSLIPANEATASLKG